MDRKYIFIIVILLSITLVIADYYMNKSLESVEYLNFIDDNEVAVNGLNVDELTFEPNLQEALTYVNLTITNKQNDDLSNEYTYNIKIDSISGAHKYLKTDGSTDYQVFSANGETTFTLKNNESITFIEIPINSNYTITQDNLDNYKTYINEEEKNTITSQINKDTSVTFGNYNKTITPLPVPDPVKPTPEKDKNPTTSDYIVPVFITFITVTLILLTSLKLKIKRFE